MMTFVHGTVKTFVPTKTPVDPPSLASDAVLPTMCSALCSYVDDFTPYTSAVSTNVTPRSTARFIASARSRSRYEFPNPSDASPHDMVPMPIAETSTPDANRRAFAFARASLSTPLDEDRRR